MCASSCIKQYVQPSYGCRGMPVQARSGLLATGPAGGLGVSHGGGQGDKSVCGVRAAYKFRIRHLRGARN